jgi:hypothetical protein
MKRTRTKIESTRYKQQEGDLDHRKKIMGVDDVVVLFTVLYSN